MKRLFPLAFALFAPASAALAASVDDIDCNARRVAGVEARIRSSPGYDATCFRFGLQLLREATGYDPKLAEAEGVFLTLRDLRPERPFGLVGLAETGLRRRELGLYGDEHAGAIVEKAERATRMRPAIPESFVTLGRAHILAGCVDCAQRATAKAVELGAASVELRLLQASIAERRGAPGEAGALLRRALAAPGVDASGRVALHLALADLLARENDMGGADREFTEAVEAGPENILAHVKRAEFRLYLRSDIDGALRAAAENDRAASSIAMKRIRSLADYLTWARDRASGRPTAGIGAIAQRAYETPEGALIVCARYPALSRAFETLLNAGVMKDLERRDGAGNTALVAAAEGNSAQKARMLLGRHADVNAHNQAGARPLSHFVAHRNHDGLRLLLDAGASVDYADADGRTPLSLAVESGDAFAVRELLARGGNAAIAASRSPGDLLTAAATREDVVTMRQLLDAGMAPDTPDHAGLTPLVVAATRHSLPAVRELLARGADPREALRFAEKAGDAELIDTLRAATKHGI